MIKGALVLQGGGMRGVYVSGVLDALMENGIFFESTYGVSAGAKNSQYYISGQIGEALKVDIHCSKDKKAISISNLLFEGGIISADYYNNYIMKELAPLNQDFYTSKQLLHIGMTNCLTGECDFVTQHKAPLRDSITASCSIPLVQQIKYVNNIPYLDGGISESIPIKEAIKDGYEKILVILTREKDFMSPKANEKMNMAYKLRYRKYPNLVNKLLVMDKHHNELLTFIKDKENKKEIFCIYPSKAPNISMLERNENKLKELYNLGKNDMLDNIDSLLKYLESK